MKAVFENTQENPCYCGNHSSMKRLIRTSWKIYQVNILNNMFKICLSPNRFIQSTHVLNMVKILIACIKNKVFHFAFSINKFENHNPLCSMIRD